MRTASTAKLVLTAAVGLGTLFGLAGTAEAAAPPPGPGTLVLAPQGGHDTAPDDRFAAPTTTTVPEAEPADPAADLPLANPTQTGPAADPSADDEPGEAEDDCEPVPGAADCPPEDCVPVSTQPDPWAHCDDPECPEPRSSAVPLPPEDCDDPECPEPRGSAVPLPSEDCDDPECPDVVVLNASTSPTDDPGRPEDCDDPECPETGRPPVARIQAQERPRPEDCDDPECPEAEDRPESRIQAQERPRPEDCDRPECPETEDRPESRRQAQELEEPRRPEDCDRRPPCEPKPGEDESCKLPRTGTDMGTYVAAGVGLTGTGAALKGLQRVLRRRRR